MNHNPNLSLSPSFLFHPLQSLAPASGSDYVGRRLDPETYSNSNSDPVILPYSGFGVQNSKVGTRSGSGQSQTGSETLHVGVSFNCLTAYLPAQ